MTHNLLYLCVRSKTSNVSSPTTSVGSSAWPVRSPPATRLRSRQVSTTVGTGPDDQTKSLPDRASKTLKGKGKAKQVEFKLNVEVRTKTSALHLNDEDLPACESDLTELEELEKSIAGGSTKLANAAQPSPRRLRSRDKQRTTSGVSISSQQPSTSRQRSSRRDQDAKREAKSTRVNGWGKTRALPARKAKFSREGSQEEEAEVEEEDELLEDVDSEEVGSQDEGEEGEGKDVTDNASSEEEIDELASATSSPVTRRTPLKKRLRPRRKQGSAGPSDGDDEGDGGEPPPRRAEEDTQDDEAESVDLDGEDTDTASEREDDEEAVAIEPRKLRSGKIVGEEDVDMSVEEDIEEDIGEEDEGNEEEDGDIAEAEEDEIEDEDGRGEEDAEGEIDDAMDDEGEFMYLIRLFGLW